MLVRLATLTLVFALPAAGVFAQSSGVTIYRCVDAKGHVTLGDTPCTSGSRQEVRTMQRPQDAPPPAPTITPAAAPAATPPPPPPQVVVVRTPQPMYECTTPDGERYTSETGDGNPRWVPLWTLGYRSGRRGGIDASRGALREADSIHARVGAPAPSRTPIDISSRPGRPGPARPAYGAGAGTWIRDACHPLPQGEVCARLVDRREEIRRRAFNAQETERNALRREERGINARLAADCG